MEIQCSAKQPGEDEVSSCFEIGLKKGENNLRKSSMSLNHNYL